MTVSLITQKAKMARNTFYSLFPGQKAAFEYACELGNSRLLAAIESATAGSRDREERLEAALAVLVAAIESAPYLAELILVHAQGTYSDDGAPQALLPTLAALMEPEEKSAKSPIIGELLAGGVLFLLAERLRRGDVDGLGRIAPEVTKLVALDFKAGGPFEVRPS